MDIKSFIESGILEAYILGSCTDAERAEVIRMTSVHPEVQSELDTLESVLESFAYKAAVTPSPTLRQKVLDAVDAAVLDQPIPKSKPQPQQPIAEHVLPKRSFSWANVAIAACLTLLAGYFFGQNVKLKENLQAEQVKVQTCEERSSKLQGLEQQIAVISNKNTKSFEVLPLPEKDQNLFASVYNNPTDKVTLVNLSGMHTPPAGKSYQLWALVNGTPVSMGVINIDPSLGTGIASVPFIENAQGFAVSLEPVGGSPTPTEVIMLGTT